MKSIRLIFGLFGLLLLTWIKVHASGKEEGIFLCLDTAANNSEEILYYTYIDGNRSECMKKHEILLYINRHEQEKGKREPLSSKSSEEIIKLIDKGEKRLPGANISNTDLMGIDLKEAVLRDADLRSCDLRKSNMRRADLSGADLSGSFLKDADLSETDLLETSFSEAVLINTNLVGAKGLTPDSLLKASTLYRASLPEDIRAKVKSLRPSLFKESKGYWEESSWSEGDECENIKPKPMIR